MQLRINLGWLGFVFPGFHQVSPTEAAANLLAQLKAASDLRLAAQQAAIKVNEAFLETATKKAQIAGDQLHETLKGISISADEEELAYALIQLSFKQAGFERGPIFNQGHARLDSKKMLYQGDVGMVKAGGKQYHVDVQIEDIEGVLRACVYYRPS